jgi:hypothetical protein
MVGILVDSDLHATSCVPCDKLVIDEDMTIMAPIGAAPAFRLGVEDAKFKRHFTRVDSQEHVRKEAGGFVCHTFFFFAKKHLQTAKSRQGYMNMLFLPDVRDRIFSRRNKTYQNRLLKP